jgi:hypothetical protein
LRNAWLVIAAFVCTTSTVFAQSSITLAWDASSDPAVTGYILSWGTTAGSYSSSLNVGKVTQYTVAGLNPDIKYTFAVQAYTATSVSDYSTPVSNNPFVVQTSAGATFLDQRPGLFWRNRSTGQVSTWLLSGATVLDTRPLGIDRVPDTNWFVAATADFTGDGYTDVLWRNGVDGSLALWALQNNDVVGTQYLSIRTVADPNWKIVGAADLDRDGSADIIWQHQTQGWLAVWFIRGTTVVRTSSLDIPQVSSNNWQIAAVVDLNNDGYPDLVWREKTQGWLAAWYLRGTAVIAQANLSQSQVADPTWKLVGGGKPGGPSQPPTLIWQNSADGTIAFWYMNGTTLLGSAYTNPGRVDNLLWQIVGSR